MDSIQLATELGRLDFISALLALIGIILVCGGVFAFMNIRGIAKDAAKDEATAISQEVAERVANEYLQEELPNILNAYGYMFDDSDLTDDESDSMANTQDGKG